MHKVGVISMYLASKFEDVVPLHAKVVSEKIAHGTMTPQQVVEEEKKFLKLLNYQIDLVTPFDFVQTLVEKISQRLNSYCQQAKE